MSIEEIYHQHLRNISGRILGRNQDDPSKFLSSTYEIDQELDAVTKRMPQSWWQIPNDAFNDRTDEASSQFERMMCQVWHYELRILLHLPFMLCASADRRYEYSRISCLDSCRNLIQRWIFIRERKSPSLFSNLVEFQAFTSTITLLLSYLEPKLSISRPAHVAQERSKDLQLAEKVVQILEKVRDSGAGVQLVNQSISAIRRLQGVIQNEPGSSKNLRLEIPHFGTINIARSGIVQSAEGWRMLDASQRLDEISREATSLPRARTKSLSVPAANIGPVQSSVSTVGSEGFQDVGGVAYGESDDDVTAQNTVFQFWSNQFPNIESPREIRASEWQYGENEVMLFDSLLSSDTYGSWDLFSAP
jgi:hypothetical protein